MYPGSIGEKTDQSNAQDKDLERYAAIIRKLAEKYNCGMVDLRKAFIEYNLENNKENKDKGILTSDGVHLNEAGNRLVAEEIMKVIIS